MRFTIGVAMCDPSHYLPLALAAEQYGFDTVSVPDSVFYPEKISIAYYHTPDGNRWWTAETPWIDPWVAIPAMAAVTKRVRFYTGVMKFPLRNPILVAKTVGSAAVLSNNRVALGVGLSWIPEEFKWTKMDWHARGELANEGIEIVRSILAGGMVEYHGKHYDFDRLQMSPAPTQLVPIYVGGWTMPAYRRAVRLGDGLIFRNSPRERPLPEVINAIKELRKEYGKERSRFDILAGNPDSLDLDSYKRMQELGVTDFSVTPWAAYKADANSLAAKQASMERFANEVIVKLKARVAA